MLFSYHWLKELSGTKRSPQKLADLLMVHAFEVESVEAYPHGIDNVVIGEVLSVAPHPQADRLRVAQVRVGKKAVHTIVCGAPNLAPHQKVAVALPGAHLPGGVVIQESELRGVKSVGMICSARELGLGMNHEGILVLPQSAAVGKDFLSYAGLDDTVMDIKILPDRSTDALSYRGLAREIAALEGHPVAFEVPSPTRTIQKSFRVPKITLQSERCKRYRALLLPQLQSTVTPLKVQGRLILSGLRPISPVVDLTNYLMLETGQPIHAFDAEAIPKGGIVVRQAKAREKLLLLDGTSLPLTPDDIVIADAKKPIGLAGVMGGKHSGIDDTTKKVVFEIAHFEASSIRRTEKRHRLLTDAAYRFERGIDLGRIDEVTPLLAHYVEDWGLGKDITFREVGGKLPKPKTIVLELETVASLLGVKVPLFEVVQYCSWLGLSVKKLPNRQALSIVVPLRRPDLNFPEDIIEEIGRMRGYDTIDPIPLTLPAQPRSRDEGKYFERELKKLLTAAGLSEVMTYSFYGEQLMTMSGLEKTSHLDLANPMNPDQAYLRASLFPNLFKSVEQNAKQFDRFSLFEYGSVFVEDKAAPHEEKRLGIMIFDRHPSSAQDCFLRSKSRLENIFATGGVTPNWESQATHTPRYYHPTRVARLTLGDKLLGYAGIIHPNHLQRLGKKAALFYADISLEIWQALQKRDFHYQGISRFPMAERDISLIGPKSVTFAQLKQVMDEAGAPLLRQSELFDLYETASEKSFAFHLGFGSPERTLSSQEMDAAFDAIVARTAEHLGMRLRLEVQKESGDQGKSDN
ncbi:MAG: phenylalanine--tRNA ligase subunit beta [Candidatus Moraniibacteriota bacterium]|nr:MAG: phenylalanine--tRNA ligase subunit beta [Candidatus Moranbacteria bacterium]